MAERNTKVPTRALGALADKANAEHRAAQEAARSALEHARRAGDLLIQAKEQVKHGGWQVWLEEHVEFSSRTARLYMRISRRWPELEAATENGNALPIREADRLLREPASDDFEDTEAVPDIVDDEKDWAVQRGHQAMMLHPFGEQSTVFVRPADLPEFFWVTISHSYGMDEGGHVEATKRPIHGSALQLFIDVCGFPVAEGEWIDLGPRDGEDYNSIIFGSRDDQREKERRRWRAEAERWQKEWPQWRELYRESAALKKDDLEEMFNG